MRKIGIVGDELNAEIVRLFGATLPFHEHAFIQSEVLEICCKRVASSLRRAGVSIPIRLKVKKAIRDECTHLTSTVLRFCAENEKGFSLPILTGTALQSNPT